MINYANFGFCKTQYNDCMSPTSPMKKRLEALRKSKQGETHMVKVKELTNALTVLEGLIDRDMESKIPQKNYQTEHDKPFTYPYLKNNNYMCKITPQLRKFPHLNLPIKEGFYCNRNIRVLQKAFEINELSSNKMGRFKIRNMTTPGTSNSPTFKRAYDNGSETAISITSLSPCRMGLRNNITYNYKSMNKKSFQAKKLEIPITKIPKADSTIKRYFNKTCVGLSNELDKLSLGTDDNKNNNTDSNCIFRIKIKMKRGLSHDITNEFKRIYENA